MLTGYSIRALLCGQLAWVWLFFTWTGRLSLNVNPGWWKGLPKIVVNNLTASEKTLCEQNPQGKRSLSTNVLGPFEGINPEPSRSLCPHQHHASHCQRALDITPAEWGEGQTLVNRLWLMIKAYQFLRTSKKVGSLCFLKFPLGDWG